MRKLLLLSAGVAACLASPAFAQATDDEKYIGIGVRVRPAYEGADSSRGEVIPYLRLYGDHLFARTTQGMLEGGWRTGPYGAWVFGAQVAYEDGRVADDSAFLKDHHFGDLDPGASIGLHADGDWKIGAVNLSGHWLIPWGASVQQLQGDAVDSPISPFLFHLPLDLAPIGRLWPNRVCPTTL